MTCQTCFFMVQINTGIKRGQCRRHAPILETGGAQPKTLWPMVHTDAFCGDYRERIIPRQPEASHDG